MPGKRGGRISKHKEHLNDFGELFNQLCEYLDVKDIDIARLSGVSKSSISRITRSKSEASDRQPSNETITLLWEALEQVSREKSLPLTQELKDIFYNIDPVMHATPEQAESAKQRMNMVYSMLEEARKHAREKLANCSHEETK